VETIYLTLIHSVALALGMHLLSPCQDKRDAKLEADVNSLIKDLGDNAFSVREKATGNLLRIGLPALAALLEATESSDLETQSRAARLVDRIRSTNNLPPLVDGLEFRCIIDKDWVVPEQGVTAYEIKLVITNTKASVCRFKLCDAAVRIVIRDNDGKQLKWRTSGVERLMDGPRVSPPIGKNESLTIKLDAFLSLTKGKVRVVAEDSYSNCDLFDLPSKGSYGVSLLYEPRGRAFEQETIWRGKVETSIQTINIK
jgi:hypothetical protein